MDRIRAFVADDIPQVADLHRRVFKTDDRLSKTLEESYRSYFENIFLSHPWYDGALPSLVYEDGGGKILGFMGVTPRRMSLRGQSIQAVISSQFIVEPGGRSAVAAVKLVKTLMSGPQDLCIADEANDASRKLWEAAGGSTALLYSMYWLRPLRLSEWLVRSWGRAGLPAIMASGSAPFCRLLDAVIADSPRIPFRLASPSLSGEELEPEALLHCMTEFSACWSLRPQYDKGWVKWLLELLAEKNGHGSCQKVALRSPAGEIVGWYVALLNRGGIGEVLQIGARNGWMGHVLDHLFYHAWQKGAVALSGRLEPKLLDHFHDRQCLFQHRRGYWTLIHSSKPELLEAFYRGDAFVSRLDGEWSLRFK
ncbi:MAG: GNAT family N-acetyltransferase [Deltaproteobacteria bacterium]|nr:GNAT family N-acetyltransferase [Deltaproteobacteria bacterium]